MPLFPEPVTNIEHASFSPGITLMLKVMFYTNAKLDIQCRVREGRGGGVGRVGGVEGAGVGGRGVEGCLR